MRQGKIVLALGAGFLALAGSLAADASTPGVFNVSDYTASGSHTDYDMARQAADAYVVANPWTGSVLILKAGVNETCDAVPLPSIGVSGGQWATTSILGLGSGKSRIVKSASCASSAATLSHMDSPNGQLSRGLYQGFTVDANHIDQAACNFYGMSLTTFLDVACGNAAANSDHELEFGNRDANSLGWMDNIYIYDLKTFDSVTGGKGAVLTPVWQAGVLAGVTVANPGTQAYTSQYVRARVIGPDLGTCSTVPTLQPVLGANSLVAGATILNGGSCASTAHLYILIQDGTPVTYGMKFSNMADSHAWGLQATGSTTYGESWLMGSNNNSIYNEQPGTNQYIQITDNANGNRHINPVFVSPGGYGAEIDSQNGTFQNATFRWDSTSYVGASGFYFGNDPRVYQDWMINGSVCTNSSSSNFVAVATRSGVLSSSNPVPAGVNLRNIHVCNGTNTVSWSVVTQ